MPPEDQPLPPPQTIYVDEYGQQITAQPTVTPFQQEQSDNIIKYQLETFEDMVKLMRTFRGEIWNPTQKEWYKPTRKQWIAEANQFVETEVEPMMNEEGIAEIIAFVMEGKNILLSKYDKRTLYLTLRALLNTMTRMIYNNHSRYGMKDTATADTVMDIVFNHLQAVFLAAESGEMRIYFQKQIREQHSFQTVVQQQPQKKRFFFI